MFELKKKKCKLVFQNAFVFSIWKNHLREIIYFMLCVLKWEAENTDLLRSWGLERVGTEEEETIPSKKNSEEFCCIPKHRNYSCRYPQKDAFQGIDKVNLGLFFFFFLRGGGCLSEVYLNGSIVLWWCERKVKDRNAEHMGPNSAHTSLPISGMMPITVLYKLQATILMLKTQKSKREGK